MLHARMNPSRAGLILRFDGASADTDRSQISSLCAHFGEVAYVDFRFGETMGFVRFRKFGFGELDHQTSTPIISV